MAAILGLDTLNPATLLSRRFRASELPSLAGRTAIVTGGSAGIGYSAALALARARARVLIVSSTPEHGKQAAAEMNAAVREAHPDSKDGDTVKWYGCQFGDLKAVDKLAKELAKEERLDILINNAGVGQVPPQLVECGLENHFAINDLAHYVLTLRLLPLMQKTAASAPPASVRIVMQSSELHRAAPSDTQFMSAAEINAPRDPIVGYGRSKLGLVLLARQLAKRRLSPSSGGGAPIVVTSVHPGTVDTDMQEAWTEAYGALGSVANSVTRVLGKSADEGAEACLWAAASTEIGAENWAEYQGNYYQEARGKPGTESDQAKDEKLGDQFWEFCRAQTKEILGEDLE